jgi:hypothetical protein
MTHDALQTATKVTLRRGALNRLRGSAPADFSWPRPRFRRAIRRHFTKRSSQSQKNRPVKLICYPWATIVPSGNATTKNGFDGLSVADCSALSPEKQNSSLAFPDRVKLPDEILCRIMEMATTIMVTATIRDKRIKSILSQGCTA